MDNVKKLFHFHNSNSYLNIFIYCFYALFVYFCYKQKYHFSTFIIVKYHFNFLYMLQIIVINIYPNTQLNVFDQFFFLGCQILNAI